MKKIFVIAALICCTALWGGAAGALTLDFATVTGAKLNFDGSSHFNFPNLNIYDFRITASDSAGQTSVGYFGNIGNDNFVIGKITNDEAPVTGSTTFSITDTASEPQVLSGTLTFETIYTFKKTGGIDSGVKANLTGMSYSGTDIDLLQFVAGGILSVSFQWTDLTHTLTYLAANPASTSYSGSMTAVPIPGALLLLGAGLARLAAYARRRKEV